MIHAYNEEYLSYARNLIGKMFDFAVYDLGYNLKDFFDMFIQSGIADKISKGDTSVLGGKSGYEVALQVVNILKGEVEITFPNHSYNRSKEYWLGHTLAYYQWYSNISFSDIVLYVSIDDLLKMYDKYHEMDVRHFVDKINEIIYNSNKLKYYRKKRKLTQKELSKLSKVPLRTIQQYEQGNKDLSKANVSYLINLSSVLFCMVEDLL